MQAHTHTEPHTGHHEAHHHEPGFMQKYIFSTDHKMIGIQYGLTALAFLLFGFFLMLCMRWQIAHPGKALPIVGAAIEALIKTTSGNSAAPGGAMSPELYNVFGAMHGTIMVFLAIVPLAFGAFGNYVVPLMIGAPDMAFPRVNMASYQFYFLGGVVMFEFFHPGQCGAGGLDFVFSAGFDH